MSRILVIEHEADAPAALFGEWMGDAGAELVVCRPWAGDEVPPLRGPEGAAYDGWLVLGGEMGAEDDDVAPWLPVVRDRIAEAARTGVWVLGICLGHQLAAVATGGRVEVNPAGRRIGLYDVGWLPDADRDPLLGGLGASTRAVQWNNDVVVEPGEGARVLAAFDGGEVQAARFADTVWGVQWHPEVDRRVLESWAEGAHDDGAGRDVDEVLDEVEAAAEILERAWRPLAEAFAVRAGERR
jgi:GMP synthase (glutamine-hydrolysing)